MTLLKWKKGNDLFPAFGGWMDDFANEDIGRFPRFNANPSVNIKESDVRFELEVAIPGFSKDDFNIDIDENILTISGNKEDKKEEEEKGYTRKEFSYSSFKRSFTLPDTIKVDKIDAKYNDGILNIVLPKKEEAATLKKSIKVS